MNTRLIITIKFRLPPATIERLYRIWTNIRKNSISKTREHSASPGPAAFNGWADGINARKIYLKIFDVFCVRLTLITFSFSLSLHPFSFHWKWLLFLCIRCYVVCTCTYVCVEPFVHLFPIVQCMRSFEIQSFRFEKTFFCSKIFTDATLTVQLESK